jgi:WD40 repeat protein
VAVSPDRRLVATISRTVGGDATEVSLWDLDSRKQVVRFSSPDRTKVFYSLGFSPDGKLLVTDMENSGFNWIPRISERLLWDVSTGRALQVGTFKVRPVFTPDSKHCFEPTSSGGELYASLPLQQGPSLVIPGDTCAVVFPASLPEVQCSPDGHLVAIGGLWSLPERSPVIEWFSQHIFAIPATPGEQRVRLWDVETGNQHASFVGYDSVMFSQDSTLLAALRHDGTLELWDLPMQSAQDSWWLIIGVALATTITSLAVLLASARRLSRRTRRAEPAHRAT